MAKTRWSSGRASFLKSSATSAGPIFCWAGISPMARPLRAVLKRGPEAILEELVKSGLRGQGGAGFKSAAKWMSCRNAPGEVKYVVCNADEGEPGTFKDRVLMQDYADLVFEGMTLCGRVIGARQGFVYLRGEYRYLVEALRRPCNAAARRDCWARRFWAIPVSSSTSTSTWAPALTSAARNRR
jgi:hypothetical protein